MNVFFLSLICSFTLIKIFKTIFLITAIPRNPLLLVINIFLVYIKINVILVSIVNVFLCTIYNQFISSKGRLYLDKGMSWKEHVLWV